MTATSEKSMIAKEDLRLYAKSPVDGSLRLIAQGSQITFAMKEFDSTAAAPTPLSTTGSVEFVLEQTPGLADFLTRLQQLDDVHLRVQDMPVHQSPERQKPYGRKFRRSRYG